MQEPHRPLSLTGLSDDADVYLLNSAGVEVTHSYNFGTASEAITISNLAAGTYYVQVKPYNTASTNYTLDLSAKSLTLSSTSATLDANSPHYADQLPLFVKERTKRVPLTEAELLADGAKTYRPGEARPD